MKQILIPKAGKSNILKIIEKDDPRPKAGEVVIDVRASGINFADILARQGIYPDAPPYPCVVGYEVSGVIREVGEGVEKCLLGKEVIAICRFGGYSSVVSVSVDQVFEKPWGMDFNQAAAIPVNYLTAYQLLVVMGGLSAGESVLIHNAGGGVGLAALDIAKHIGATIYGTASQKKHEFLIARGLHHAIDYRNEDWRAVLNNLTRNRGVDLIIDPIGGKNWSRSFKSLRSTGRLGMFGVSTSAESSFGGKLRLLKALFGMPIFNPISLMNSNKGAFGVNLGQMWHEKEKVKKWGEVILEGYKDGWVRPHVDRSFPFSEASSAHDYIEQRQNIGKVVLIPD